MKKILSVLTGLLALIAGFRAGAQPNPIKDKSLLWRISGKELARPSYLFGTIHLICRNDFIWTEKMKESLNKSEKVCFEMNLSDPEVITQATTALMESLSKKLMDNMSDDLLAKMTQLMSDTSGKEKPMKEGDPMALQSMLGGAGLNCNDPISYEDSIMKMAGVDKKEIMGLEQPSEQVAVLETMPLDSLLSMLMDGGLSKDTAQGEDKELLAAYKNQDLPALYDLVTSAKGPAINIDLFLDDRNKKWIPRIEDKMKHSSVFFAVGAGHLAGANGVITLLRKQGYKVEPVK